MTSIDIAKAYYHHFNNQNWEGMIGLVHPEVRHEPNQSDDIRIGIAKFTSFLQHMDECYEETLSDMVFFSEPSHTRVAVEFLVHGLYKKGDEGLPTAKGQSYLLPAAAFLEFREGKISRITTYYNLPNWIKQVS